MSPDSASWRIICVQQAARTHTDRLGQLPPSVKFWIEINVQHAPSGVCPVLFDLDDEAINDRYGH